ncbi:hypothetical protein [Streptosporangium sp. NPDC049046]|uniref:hypothetical protein n=1 Tax=Streptosporangium sp. NPDC049046 TaxID=3155031 RepID=UPI003447F3A6
MSRTFPAAPADDIALRLRQAAARWRWWPVALLATEVVSLALMEQGLLVNAVGLSATLMIGLLDRRGAKVNVHYDPQGISPAFHEIVNAMRGLQRAQRLWFVAHEQAVTNDHQRKTNAGASQLFRRKAAHSDLVGPKTLVVDIPVPTVRVKGFRLHLFPDVVLLHGGGQILSLPYPALRVAFACTRTVENEQVPSDTRIIGSTWLYVNKNGGPDRRFKDNRELPIVEYGRLTVTGPDIDIDIVWQCSNVEALRAFFAALRGAGMRA